MAQSVTPAYQEEIAAFQQQLNEEFANSEESPLPKKALKKFKGLAFYPADEKFRVTAAFTQTADAVPFQMKTTTNRLPTYEKYGEVTFAIDGQNFKLNIYQSHSLRETEAYKNYLFLPFTDLTNGEETYGGGRFIDLSIPEGNTMVIDFNKAYNPYCAYNPKYSCPIPPRENNLNLRITAGVLNPEK